MADIVQQGRGDEKLRLLPADRFRESLVVREMPEKKQREPIDSKRVLKPAVGGGRIDQGNKPKLRNPRQAAELREIDEIPHPLGERHVQLRREANHSPGGIESGNLGN